MCDLTIINAGVILQEANSGEHMAGGFVESGWHRPSNHDENPDAWWNPREIQAESCKSAEKSPRFHGTTSNFSCRKIPTLLKSNYFSGKKEAKLSRLQILAGCTPLWCWNPSHVYQWNPRGKSSGFRLNEATQNNQDRTALELTTILVFLVSEFPPQKWVIHWSSSKYLLGFTLHKKMSENSSCFEARGRARRCPAAQSHQLPTWRRGGWW